MKHIKSHIYKIISFVLIAVVLTCSSLSNTITAYAVAPPIADDVAILEALAAILEYLGIHVALADSLSHNKKAVATSLQVIEDNRQAIIDGSFDEATYLAALHAKEQELAAYNNKQATSDTFNMLNQISYNNLGIAGSYGLYNILHNAYEYYSTDGNLTADLTNMLNGNFADSSVIKFETMAALFGLQVISNADIYKDDSGNFNEELLVSDSAYSQFNLLSLIGKVHGINRTNTVGHVYYRNGTLTFNNVCCFAWEESSHVLMAYYIKSSGNVAFYSSNTGITGVTGSDLPLYRSYEDVITSYANNDASLIMNGASSTLDSFIDAVLPLSDVLDDSLSAFDEQYPTIGDLKTLSGSLADTVPAVKGTTSAVGTIEDLLTRTIQDLTAPTDVLGFLKSILTATQVLFNPIVATRTAIEDLVEIFPATTALLQDLVDTVPATLATISTLVDTVPAVGDLLLDAVIDLPNTITLPLIGALEGIATDLADIKTAVVVGDTPQPTPTPDEDDNSSPSIQPSIGANLWGLNLLWILLLLIYILLKCLLIFANMLTYTLCIFRIPANTTFINEDMLSAILYLKNLKISPLTISVYDFFFGLIYILMFFALLKLIQNFVKKIRVPG